ncbi:hypothetical protein QBC38DRAFT_445920 [Podospora fimiseda]|uniref:Uncharacterized protein n=1 Tax=Podospora fimiseda TaxID=252190 RepID=A0AAN7GUB5_9PEZI|nr:hypothetical protein QBC38DRAFT_445920 [Podospora fimiseda]
MSSNNNYDGTQRPIYELTGRLIDVFAANLECLPTDRSSLSQTKIATREKLRLLHGYLWYWAQGTDYPDAAAKYLDDVLEKPSTKHLRNAIFWVLHNIATVAKEDKPKDGYCVCNKSFISLNLPKPWYYDDIKRNLSHSDVRFCKCLELKRSLLESAMRNAISSLEPDVMEDVKNIFSRAKDSERLLRHVKGSQMFFCPWSAFGDGSDLSCNVFDYLECNVKCLKHLRGLVIEAARAYKRRSGLKDPTGKFDSPFRPSMTFEQVMEITKHLEFTKRNQSSSSSVQKGAENNVEKDEAEKGKVENKTTTTMSKSNSLVQQQRDIVSKDDDQSQSVKKKEKIEEEKVKNNEKKQQPAKEESSSSFNGKEKQQQQQEVIIDKAAEVDWITVSDMEGSREEDHDEWEEDDYDDKNDEWEIITS